MRPARTAALAASFAVLALAAGFGVARAQEAKKIAEALTALREAAADRRCGG